MNPPPDWETLPYAYRALHWCVLHTLQQCLHTIEWPSRGEDLVGMEVPFLPARLLLQDASGLNLVQDLLCVAEDHSALIRMDLVVDHGIITEAYGNAGAELHNRSAEMTANLHRYHFFQSAAKQLPSLTIHPPGSGVIHQLNLERLAPKNAAFSLDQPQDSVLGTDSHTPIINALGVPGWGVGALEALFAASFGPVSLAIPPVILVYLKGAIPVDCTPTDLALLLANRLRKIGVNGFWVEFSGPGLDYLAIEDRAILAGMAPEYGCQMAFFPVDHISVAYMERIVGSTRARRWQAVSQARGLWRETRLIHPVTRKIGIDLNELRPITAGPRYPWQQQTISKPDIVRLAAITSCTNGAHPRMLIRAALLARNAFQAGIIPPPHVKTILAPSSTRTAAFLRESGLIRNLERIGFFDCGIGCGPCLGHCGSLPPLPPGSDDSGCAVISGNRNFPGRIHADLEAVFLASPEQVVAAALSGNWSGPVSPHSRHPLSRFWPEKIEVECLVQQWMSTTLPLRSEKSLRNQAKKRWRSLTLKTAGSGCDLKIIDASPLPHIPAPSRLEHGCLSGARILLKLGNGVTTDHISPVGPIPENSEAGRFISEHGDSRQFLGSYASWRANAEVMLRGGFSSPSLPNMLLCSQTGSGLTVLPGSKHPLPAWRAARIHQARFTPLLIVAGTEYGAGSARDWAARVTRLLGVEAVIAQSFEEIHRRNLIAMGVIPLLYAKSDRAPIHQLEVDHTLTIENPNDLYPQSRHELRILEKTGQVTTITLTAAVKTSWEASLLRQGGIPAMMN